MDETQLALILGLVVAFEERRNGSTPTDTDAGADEPTAVGS